MFLSDEVDPMAGASCAESDLAEMASMADMFEFRMTVNFRKIVKLLISLAMASGLLIAIMSLATSRVDSESFLSSTTISAPGAALYPEECGADRMTKDELASKIHFINTVKNNAAQAANELGIPTEWVIAHWALESGYTLNANNNLAGLYAYRGSPFGPSGKTYSSLEAFTVDYVVLLKSNSSYAAALRASSIADYARQLGLAGYAGPEGAEYADHQTWYEAVYLCRQVDLPLQFSTAALPQKTVTAQRCPFLNLSPMKTALRELGSWQVRGAVLCFGRA
jgi:hypothetical protein